MQLRKLTFAAPFMCSALLGMSLLADGDDETGLSLFLLAWRIWLTSALAAHPRPNDWAVVAAAAAVEVVWFTGLQINQAGHGRLGPDATHMHCAYPDLLLDDVGHQIQYTLYRSTAGSC